MGMASSDDEEQIWRDRKMVDDYSRMFPHRIPKQNASEMEHALFDKEARDYMQGPPPREPGRRDSINTHTGPKFENWSREDD